MCAPCAPGSPCSPGAMRCPCTSPCPAHTGVDENVERGDIPYTVMVNAESGTLPANSAFILVLRTSLTDYEGNALVEEVRVPFRTGP